MRAVPARTSSPAIAAVGALLGLALWAGPARALDAVRPGPSAGEPGQPGLALFAAKVLTVAPEGPGHVDRGVVLVRDGRIEAVGVRGRIEVPEGYIERDLGDLWLMPGMIDLHSHIAGSFDINDSVYQANPELRVHVAVVPENQRLAMAVAGGVTTILFIPGSATTVGGQGVLLKTWAATYEAMLVRAAGALKVAQADNPVRWGYGMGRIGLNWQIREISRRGVGYARRWEAFEAGTGPEPEFDPMFEIYRELSSGRAQIATHTQVAQVVLSSIRILVHEFGLPTFIAHGTFDAFKIAHIAEEAGVPAILGPRNISVQLRSRGVDHDGRFEGVAAGYQRAGHSAIGFNTDAPVIPAEELFLQAAMAVRMGFEDRNMETVRGLTAVPARTAGIDDRVGSIEPGKHADLVALRGHPADPRSAIEFVWIEGRAVYDAARDGRRF